MRPTIDELLKQTQAWREAANKKQKEEQPNASGNASAPAPKAPNRQQAPAQAPAKQRTPAAPKRPAPASPQSSAPAPQAAPAKKNPAKKPPAKAPVKTPATDKAPTTPQTPAAPQAPVTPQKQTKPKAQTPPKAATPAQGQYTIETEQAGGETFYFISGPTPIAQATAQQLGLEWDAQDGAYTQDASSAQAAVAKLNGKPDSPEDTKAEPSTKKFVVTRQFVEKQQKDVYLIKGVGPEEQAIGESDGMRFAPTQQALYSFNPTLAEKVAARLNGELTDDDLEPTKDPNIPYTKVNGKIVMDHGARPAFPVKRDIPMPEGGTKKLWTLNDLDADEAALYKLEWIQTDADGGGVAAFPDGVTQEQAQQLANKVIANSDSGFMMLKREAAPAGAQLGAELLPRYDREGKPVWVVTGPYQRYSKQLQIMGWYRETEPLGFITKDPACVARLKQWAKDPNQPPLEYKPQGLPLIVFDTGARLPDGSPVYMARGDTHHSQPFLSATHWAWDNDSRSWMNGVSTQVDDLMEMIAHPGVAAQTIRELGEGKETHQRDYYSSENFDPQAYNYSRSTDSTAPEHQSENHPLSPYQHVGVNHALEYGNSMIADDMGVGKTAQAIAIISHDIAAMAAQAPAGIHPLKYIRENYRCLIITTVGAMNLVWPKEIDKFLGKAGRDSNGNVQVTYGLCRHINSPLPSTPIVITNHDKLNSRPQDLRGVNWNRIIVDEAHVLKKSKAKGNKLANRLTGLIGHWRGDAAFKVSPGLGDVQGAQKTVLTGTPIPNRIQELWSLLHFLHPEVFPSYTQFEQTFVVMRLKPVTIKYKVAPGKYGKMIKNIWVAEGYKNIPLLNKILRGGGSYINNKGELVAIPPIMVRRLKSQVFRQGRPGPDEPQTADWLPNKNHQVIPIQMTEEDRLHYNELVGDSEAVKNFTAQLAQLDSGMSDIAEALEFARAHPDRIDPAEMEELVNKAFGTSMAVDELFSSEAGVGAISTARRALGMILATHTIPVLAQKLEADILKLISRTAKRDLGGKHQKKQVEDPLNKGVSKTHYMYEDDSQKMVVFAWHKECVSFLYENANRILAELTKKYYKELVRAGVLIQGLNQKLRAVTLSSGSNSQATVHQFNHEHDVRLIVCSYALKEGVNFSAASLMIRVEPSWVPGDMNQSRDRIYRRGQERDVEIVDMSTNRMTVNEEGPDGKPQQKLVKADPSAPDTLIDYIFTVAEQKEKLQNEVLDQDLMPQDMAKGNIMLPQDESTTDEFMDPDDDEITPDQVGSYAPDFGDENYAAARYIRMIREARKRDRSIWLTLA